MTKIIDNDVICAFDVDQTLVVWNEGITEFHSDLEIRNPYDGMQVLVQVHSPHVRLLRQMKARGRFVIVWSAGGYEWAKSVVEALGLTNHVDLIMTKPIAYVDDVPVEDWLQHRIFIPMKVTT